MYVHGDYMNTIMHCGCIHADLGPVSWLSYLSTLFCQITQEFYNNDWMFWMDRNVQDLIFTHFHFFVLECAGDIRYQNIACMHIEWSKHSNKQSIILLT